MSSREDRLPDLRLGRVYLAGSVMDFSLYLFHGVLYFFVLDLGGGSLDLGLVMAAGSVAYVIAAIGGGRLSDRIPRLRLARAGCVAFAVIVTAISLCREVMPIVLLSLPLGASMGVFWPPIQAHLGDLAGPGRLASVAGKFNIAWSIGKGLGFFSAGALVEAFASFGPRGSLTITMGVAAATGLLPFLLLPGGGSVPRPAAREADRTDHRKGAAAYLRLAWIANFAAFGAGATLVAHHPKWIRDVGLGEIHSNVFLAAVFLSQMGSFLLWSAYGRWRYRRGIFSATQVVFGCALALIPFMPRFGATLLLAPFVGLGLGLAYQASIYYSLDVASGRGRQSGMHEGFLGSGNFIVPLAGGWAARTLLGVTAPYLVAAAVVLAGLVVQAAVFRISSSSGSTGEGSAGSSADLETGPAPR